MKRLSQRLCLAVLMAGGLLSAAAPAPAETIYGAGSTLAAGLFRSWFDCYGIALNGGKCPVTGVTPTSDLYAYAGVGSGVGIFALLNQTAPTAAPTAPTFVGSRGIFNPNWLSSAQGVGYPYPRFDFAGSDTTLWDSNINIYNSSAAPTGGPAIQVPVAGTAVAIAVNNTGLNIVRQPPPHSLRSGFALYLSRESYCGIFTGNIVDWADARLKRDNNNTALVAGAVGSHPIKVIVRNDSSGTTFLLSRHLEAVCDGTAAAGGFNWGGGVGTTVTWPTLTGSSFTKKDGSGGVASTVASTQFSIGYVSPDYTKMVTSPVVTPAPTVASLQNQADVNANPTNDPTLATPRAPTAAATSAGVSAFVVPTVNDARHWSAAIDGGTVTGSVQIIPTNSTNKMRNPPATAASAYPITGFTMVNFYGCYATATQTSAITAFVNWYLDTTGTFQNDFLAGRDGFSTLSSSLKNTIKAYAVTNATTGIKTCS